MRSIQSFNTYGGVVCSPEMMMKLDMSAVEEPDSKQHEVPAPCRQGCASILLFTLQKAKLLVVLLAGVTLVV